MPEIVLTCPRRGWPLTHPTTYGPGGMALGVVRKPRGTMTIPIRVIVWPQAALGHGACQFPTSDALSLATKGSR